MHFKRKAKEKGDQFVRNEMMIKKMKAGRTGNFNDEDSDEYSFYSYGSEDEDEEDDYDDEDDEDEEDDEDDEDEELSDQTRVGGKPWSILKSLAMLPNYLT